MNYTKISGKLLQCDARKSEKSFGKQKGCEWLDLKVKLKYKKLLKLLINDISAFAKVSFFAPGALLSTNSG